MPGRMTRRRFLAGAGMPPPPPGPGPGRELPPRVRLQLLGRGGPFEFAVRARGARSYRAQQSRAEHEARWVPGSDLRHQAPYDFRCFSWS
eukprot:SAG31_NODE_2728_length_5180_cov_2.415469_6_plen_90_part_00